MKELEAFVAELSEDVPPQLIEAVKDAAQCRSQVYGGDESASLEEIHGHLIRNRSQIERLEYLTTTLALLRSRTTNIVATRRASYDDAYNKAATKPSIGFNEYTSAKEKDATANVAATGELFAFRKAEKLHRDVDSAWDFCRVLLRGAESAQRDIETRIRLITLTTSLGG